MENNAENPSLSITYYAFNQNYDELNQLLAAFSKPEIGLEIARVGNERKLDAFLIEVTRRLHNYLGSAKSLVEHTRVLVKELYSGTAFYKEYVDEKDRTFKNSPLHHFVQDLRNYNVHRGLSQTAAVTSFGRDIGLDTSIKLPRRSLQNWDGWSSHARAYLKMSKGDVKLQEVVASYTAEVRTFYEWLGRKQEEVHEEEFRELKSSKQSIESSSLET